MYPIRVGKIELKKEDLKQVGEKNLRLMLKKLNLDDEVFLYIKSLIASGRYKKIKMPVLVGLRDESYYEGYRNDERYYLVFHGDKWINTEVAYGAILRSNPKHYDELCALIEKAVLDEKRKTAEFAQVVPIEDLKYPIFNERDFLFVIDNKKKAQKFFGIDPKTLEY